MTRRGKTALWVLSALVLVAWPWPPAPMMPAATETVGKSRAGASGWADEAACQGCHVTEYQAWKTSHHHLAMMPATPASVRGDFAGAVFQSDAEHYVFSRKGDEFFVRVSAPSGKTQAGAQEWRVAYTFGWEPLQQYLLDAGDGRWQALGVAWDVERRRWFHLYDGQKVDSRHPLHWSQPAQNANFMCIDCHATGFVRNFDAEKERFDSRWVMPGVGCQGCHGPAAAHLRWAQENRGKTGNRGMADKGFNIRLTDEKRQHEVDVCATCHSRRTPLGDGHDLGAPLRDDFLVSALTADLYEVDGRIKGEVFEYGSFVQSRMFAAGVVCSDCHHPHSGGLRARGDASGDGASANAVCTQCHNAGGKPSRPGIRAENLPAKNYDSPAHHHHAPGSPGAQCIACHMPGKFYMGNDFRHDHSFSAPNPEQALALGHADACLDCHVDAKAGRKKQQETERLTKHFRQWYPDARPRDGGYAGDLFTARHGRPGAAEALFRQLARDDLPSIRRAALVAELPLYPSERAGQQVLKALRHPAAEVREAAVAAAPALLPVSLLLVQMEALVRDPVRSVRLAAGWQYVQAADEGQAPPWRDDWAKEFERVQKSRLDRADAYFNLAQLYQLTGQPEKVEPALRMALQRDGNFTAAIVMLAQWREQHEGRPGEALRLLREGVKAHPDDAGLHHALGLMLVRQGERRAALSRFEKAHALESDSSDYAWVWAIALHDAGEKARAVQVLREQLQRDLANRRVRMALAGYLGGQKNLSDGEVKLLMDTLREQNPHDVVFARGRR